MDRRFVRLYEDPAVVRSGGPPSGRAHSVRRSQSPTVRQESGLAAPGGHRLRHRHDLASEPAEERSRRVTGSLAESPIDENWFNERRENQKKSGPETPGRLRMG